MNPSQVRTRIIEDHAALRQLLLELEDAVVTMLGSQATTPRVLELARTLLSALTRHTELEDTLLAPALLELDAWGRVRANQLLDHHYCQRAQIHALTDALDLALNAQDIARITGSLIDDLRADMEHEERELLSADVLRDDIVALGSECG